MWCGWVVVGSGVGMVWLGGSGEWVWWWWGVGVVGSGCGMVVRSGCDVWSGCSMVSG